MESPGSQHTAVLLGCVEARCPRRYRFCASGVFSSSCIFNRYCQYQSTTTNRELNLWLERIESPGSRRTAVLQSRVESRCPRRHLEKIKGDKLGAGYVAGDGGVAGISAHSSPAGLRVVTLSETSRFHRYCEYSSKQRMGIAWISAYSSRFGCARSYATRHGYRPVPLENSRFVSKHVYMFLLWACGLLLHKIRPRFLCRAEV